MEICSASATWADVGMMLAIFSPFTICISIAIWRMTQ